MLKLTTFLSLKKTLDLFSLYQLINIITGPGRCKILTEAKQGCTQNKLKPIGLIEYKK